VPSGARGVAMVVVVGVALVACSGGTDTSLGAESSIATSDPAASVIPSTIASSAVVEPTTTMVPTTIAATTTVSPTTATTTTVYYLATPSFYPPESLSPDGASGSGCSHGAGALPNGVWFGYITAGGATWLEFDLACWYFGDLAWEIADTYGDTAENDYYIVNQNPTLRTVPVATGTTAHHIDPMSVGHDPHPYRDWLFEPPGYLECPFGFCPLWLYVNDGKVTEILEPYVP
jgi:hypothetical protein